MQADRGKVGTAFPGRLEHLPTESPAILTVTNVEALREGKPPKVRGGAVWHCDQEYERLPCSCSMFLVHKLPTTREPETGTWVKDWDKAAWDSKNFQPGSDPELTRLRGELPLSGETPYADTAAAFAALPKAEQEMLEQLYVKRFGDEARDGKAPGWNPEGWMAPLVRTNPRSGVKSLHSPVFGNREKVGKIPAVEIEGKTRAETQKFLDRLEAHFLQPQFRYDHQHRPGDVTIWSNYACMHNSPPVKVGIGKMEDARLLYRISCKGPPALSLPRKDEEAWLRANCSTNSRATPYFSPPEIVNVN